MSTHILDAGVRAALYDSTTERAFGPLFDEYDDAESFCELAVERGVKLYPWTDDAERLYDEWLAGARPKAAEDKE